jgi:3-deoxy-D-manno-octulosonate 8-phosphate phosphatase (KDO 8-P phosphatase)
LRPVAPDRPGPSAPGFAPDLAARARRLRLLLFDVDGVLTDGTILLDAEGRESKRFSIRDGTALVWARQAGLLTGVLSARTAAATTARARQLGMTIVRQQATDKAAAFAEILAEQGLSAEDVAYMGDDLMDLPVLRLAGVSAAPSDAAELVRARVHFVSRQPGGGGAVREFVEGVLHAQDRWPAIEARYLSGEPGIADGPGATAARLDVDAREAR